MVYSITETYDVHVHVNDYIENIQCFDIRLWIYFTSETGYDWYFQECKVYTFSLVFERVSFKSKMLHAIHNVASESFCFSTLWNTVGSSLFLGDQCSS